MSVNNNNNNYSFEKSKSSYSLNSSNSLNSSKIKGKSVKGKVKSKSKSNKNISNDNEIEDNCYDTITEDYRMLLMNYDPKKNLTRPLLSKYERALILGKRATMIANGAEPLIDVEDGETDIIKIAEEELNKKLTPFIIERDLGNGKKEIWKIKDMIVNLD